MSYGSTIKLTLVLTAGLVALPACKVPTIRTRDVQSITVHYSIAATGEDASKKTLQIDDREFIEGQWDLLRTARRTSMVCSCKLTNYLEVQRPDGTHETWHFCHRPTVLGVYGGEILAPERFYRDLKSWVEAREGRAVALICQSEEFRR